MKNKNRFRFVSPAGGRIDDWASEMTLTMLYFLVMFLASRLLCSFTMVAEAKLVVSTG